VNLRGLITSLGAGGSLIAAALCAFVIVGSLLAVRGAVDGSAEANVGDVTLPSATPAAEETAGPRAPTAAAPGAAAVERRRAVQRRRTASRHRAPARPVSPAPAGETPAASNETGTTGEGAGGGSETRAPAPPPATGEEAAPRTVRGVVRQTREAVAPDIEAVPEPVQAPVDEVVDTVEDVTGVVDETLAPVTGLLPR
jgi:hypothetical protein